MNEAIITLLMSFSQTDVNFPGYVLYGFEEIAQWHAESNSSISVIMIMVKMMMVGTMIFMMSIMMMLALITLVMEYDNYGTLYDFKYGAKQKNDDYNKYDDSGEYEEVEVERLDLLCVCTIQVQQLFVRLRYHLIHHLPHFDHDYEHYHQVPIAVTTLIIPISGLCLRTTATRGSRWTATTTPRSSRTASPPRSFPSSLTVMMDVMTMMMDPHLITIHVYNHHH